MSWSFKTSFFIFRINKIFLLGGSYYFYAFWDARFLALIIISTLVDFWVGSWIYRTEDKKKQKSFLVLSLVINLGILAFFKYCNFFIESANLALSNLNLTISHINVILPVGISFYTFQSMSYSLDIYLKKLKPVRDPIDFALYVAFFPQLVAGPIVRATHFLPQMLLQTKLSAEKFFIGLQIFLYGLFLKVVIADNVAIHVDSIFIEGDHLQNIGLIWWGALAFGIQIYCDFSAYTDIAIGSAHLLGIRLPENFKSPYVANSPQDFWRRWHISLSTWLRDYLYISLGGSRHGKRVMLMALMATMLLGGLWHGAAWNFVLWGLLHGLLLIIHRSLKNVKLVVQFFERLPKFACICGWVTTQYFIFMTWLVFRVEDTSMLIQSLKTYVGLGAHWNKGEMYEILPEIKYLTLAIGLLFFIGHFISWKMGGLKEWISKQNSLIWGLCIGVLLTLSFHLRPAETVDFIYFRF